MDVKDKALTVAFSVVGSILLAVIFFLWDYIRQSFFVGRNMERLTNYLGSLKAQYNEVMDRVTLAGWELTSMQEEITFAGSDQQTIQVITSAESEQQASMQEEQQTSIKEVTRRLKKVESIEREVNSIQNDYSDWRTKNAAICRFCKRPFLGFKVFMKTREVSELLDQGYFKDVATKLPPPPIQELPSTSNVRAMVSNLTQTLHYLRENGVNIIGIWGIGGVGKTTLLQEINNHFAHNQHPLFDYVIFVVASKGVNFEELQKKIFKNLQLPSKVDDDINSRAAHLLRFLKKKKVLLLLDDLWEYVNLVKLGIPLGQGLCKLIFTTRLENVCGSMKAEREIKVECLNTEEAWSIFQEKVGENIIKANPEICRLAKEVVKECCGLPLALITIGRAMSKKKTWRGWQDALNLLRSSRHDEISGMSDDMFPKLEFSYKNLDNDIMRECFLTCSMWPEDMKISNYELIQSWMGLGLIDDYTEINEAYDRGHSIIESLVSACLLEYVGVDYVNGDSSVKMHDVLRDLAFWIVSDHGQNKNKWMVQAGVGLKECQVEKWVGPHRISLMHNNIKLLPEQLLDCPNLLVLMLGQSNLSNIPQGLFNCLRSLTYLDLSYTHFNKLPTSIGGMVNMKFLNLQFTPIRYLPDELGNLVNLKYLILRGTFRMGSIPWKMISGLSRLKFLDLFACRGGIKMESQDGFKALEQLDMKASLKGLGISIETVSGLSMLSTLSTISTVMLQIKHLEGIESLELLLPNHFGSKSTSESLKELCFSYCESLKTLIVNSQDLGGILRPASLPRLERLRLEDLSVVEKIIWRGVQPKEFLPSLHSLEIHGSHMLKDVSWVLQLPNLELLELSNCNLLETMIRDTKDSDGGVGQVADIVEENILAFPRLRELKLEFLQNLDNICSATIPFPSLEEISVFCCPKLKRLPFQAPNIPNKLQAIQGEAEWWEQLEWKDDHTKLLFQKYFRDQFEKGD